MERRPRLRVFTAACVAFLVPLLAGCGFFDIRDPAQPEQGIVEHIPNAPDSVLLNFQLAVEAGLSGMSVYRNTLAEAFLFKLDPIVAQRIYGVPEILLTKGETETGWRSFLTINVGRNEEVRIEFRTDLADRRDVEPPLPGTTQTVLYDEMPYYLIRYASGVMRDTVAAGGMDLYMGEESDGNWAMYIWEDKIAGSGAILTYGERIEPGSGHPRP